MPHKRRIWGLSRRICTKNIHKPASIIVHCRQGGLKIGHTILKPPPNRHETMQSTEIVGVATPPRKWSETLLPATANPRCHQYPMVGSTIITSASIHSRIESTVCAEIPHMWLHAPERSDKRWVVCPIRVALLKQPRLDCAQTLKLRKHRQSSTKGIPCGSAWTRGPGIHRVLVAVRARIMLRARGVRLLGSGRQLAPPPH